MENYSCFRCLPIDGVDEYCMWHLIVFKHSFCNTDSFFLHILYSMCVLNTYRENSAPTNWHIFPGNAKDDTCMYTCAYIVLKFFFYSCYLMNYLTLGYVFNIVNKYFVIVVLTLEISNVNNFLFVLNLALTTCKVLGSYIRIPFSIFIFSCFVFIYPAPLRAYCYSTANRDKDKSIYWQENSEF